MLAPACACTCLNRFVWGRTWVVHLHDVAETDCVGAGFRLVFLCWWPACAWQPRRLAGGVAALHTPLRLLGGLPARQSTFLDKA